MRTLILGLGNDLLGDDGIGILAARALRDELSGECCAAGAGGTCWSEGPEMCIDVVESSASGLALLDLFTGYDRAVVIDAIVTGRHRPGTVVELIPSDLGAVLAPSPHYAGLPEMFALAARLGLSFPHDIRILAVEVGDPYTVGGEVSVAVREALPDIVRRVTAHLHA